MTLEEWNLSGGSLFLQAFARYLFALFVVSFILLLATKKSKKIAIACTIIAVMGLVSAFLGVYTDVPEISAQASGEMKEIADFINHVLPISFAVMLGGGAVLASYGVLWLIVAKSEPPAWAFVVVIVIVLMGVLVMSQRDAAALSGPIEATGPVVNEPR